MVKNLKQALKKQIQVILRLANLQQAQSYSYEVRLKGKNIRLNDTYKLRNVDIGDYTYIASGAQIQNTQIGKFCSLGPNLFCGYGIHPTKGVSTAPMFYSTQCQNGMTLSKQDKIQELKPILIGNDVFIGMNVSILDGVTIGDGAVIGAGAVVSKDIPPYAIAVGCPIQVISYRFSNEIITKMLAIKWWNWEEEQLKNIEELFFDVDVFVNKHFGL
jgi:acetyltransferase-like isoleucine patch superfamily enzyme